MKTLANFDALLAEVDRQSLALGPHAWREWPMWSRNRWRWVFACEHCGVPYDRYRRRQTCLGVIGELMLAREKVPARWTAHFAERVQTARRVMKPRPSSRRK